MRRKSQGALIMASTRRPYEIMFLAAFLLYLFASVRTGDDQWFITTFLTNYRGDLGAFLTFRYLTWSTRLALETLTLLLLRFPFLFRLSMPLWLVLIAAGIERLLGGGTDKRRWLLCAGLLLLPMGINGQAGYVCTTVNYVFTLACFLWAVLPAVKTLRGESPPLWRLLLALPLMALCCNMEYYAPPVFLFCLFLLIQSLRKRKNPALPLALTAICVLSLIFAFTAPASTVGAYGAAQDLFPGYELMTTLQKLRAGFVSTAGGLVSTYSGGQGFSLGTLVFTLLLALRGWERGFGRVLHAVPLAVALSTGWAARLTPAGSLWRRLFLDGTGGWAWDSPWTLVLAVLFFATALACLWRLDRRLCGFAALALFCRITMGASRSLFFSGLRTFYPLLFVLCAASALLCMETKGRRATAVLLTGAGGMTLFHLALLFAA